MSKEIYSQKKQLIDAIDDQMVLSPNLPVAIALQEASDLWAWCAEDKQRLVAAGLDWALVDDLPLRIGALRYVQSEWQKVAQSREEAQKDWANAWPLANELRDELIHHFFHAYRKDADLCNKVSRIREGSGHADMLQDLSDLSVLGKANSVQLEAVGVDLALLDKAAAQSSELSALWGRANGERLGDNTLRIDRDRTFTYLKLAVDEIRHHGQYVFWKDESRKKGYVSRYHNKRRKNTSAGEQHTSAAAQ